MTLWGLFSLPGGVGLSGGGAQTLLCSPEGSLDHPSASLRWVGDLGRPGGPGFHQVVAGEPGAGASPSPLPSPSRGGEEGRIVGRT